VQWGKPFIEEADAGMVHAVWRGLIRVCQICDAYKVIDKKVAVIGHGRDAMGEVLFIRGYTADLTLGTPMNLTVENIVRISRRNDPRSWAWDT
jgi:thioredoxin reductase (NADPH)